jgi:hypothetical protein
VTSGPQGQSERGALGGGIFPRSARPIPEGARQRVYSAGADQTFVIKYASGGGWRAAVSW